MPLSTRWFTRPESATGRGFLPPRVGRRRANKLKGVLAKVSRNSLGKFYNVLPDWVIGHELLISVRGNAVETTELLLAEHDK